MSFFTRKKTGELPELPELPKLPELTIPRAKQELPPLPQVSEEPQESSLSEPPMTQELESEELESTPPQIRESRFPDIKRFTREPRESSIEPIFVRIDKYQESKENLQEVKRKVLEIESLLRDIREIKSREDSQLHEWDSDIQEAKAKLDKIDRIMFQKM